MDTPSWKLWLIERLAEYLYLPHLPCSLLLYTTRFQFDDYLLRSRDDRCAVSRLAQSALCHVDDEVIYRTTSRPVATASWIQGTNNSSLLCGKQVQRHPRRFSLPSRCPLMTTSIPQSVLETSTRAGLMASSHSATLLDQGSRPLAEALRYAACMLTKHQGRACHKNNLADCQGTNVKLAV